MNNKKIVAPIILGLLFSLVSPLQYSKAEQSPPPESNFTPQREAFQIEYDSPIAGFEQPTYNNFIYDLPMEGSSGYTTIDERKFLFATVVDNLEGTKTADYYNYLFDKTGTNEVFKNGDLVIFRAFFHNNGEDPYDGSGNDPVPGPEPVKSTRIGIDLRSPTNPVSFISNQKNAYYLRGGAQSGIDYNNKIKFKAGDYYFNIFNVNTTKQAVGGFLAEGSWLIGADATTASDDVTFEYDSNLPTVSLNLDAKEKLNKDLIAMSKSPITDLGASVYIEYDTDDDGEVETLVSRFVEKGNTVTENIPVKTTTLNGSQTQLNAKIPLEFSFDYDLDQKIAWIEITEHPSCFRYAGSVYFYAVIEREEPDTTQKTCKSLEWVDINSACSADPKETIFTVKTTLQNEAGEDEPGYHYVTFYTSDTNTTKPPKLTIWDGTPNGQIITTFPATAKVNNDNGTISGKYEGTGTLYAQYTDADGKVIKEIIIDNNTNTESTTSQGDSTACTASIPTCKNSCEDICVERPASFPKGSYSELKAETLDYYDSAWKDEIFYMVGTEKGAFYSTKEALLADHPLAYKNPHTQLFCDQTRSLRISQILGTIYSTRITTTPSSGFLGNIFKKSSNTKTESSFTKTLGGKLLGNLFITDPTIDTSNTINVNTIGNNLGGLSSGTTTSGTGTFTPVIPTDPGFVIPDESIPENTCAELDPTLSATEVIKANQGTSVWFYAKETGTDVIEVKGECTDNADCSQKFSITAEPTCESIGWAYSFKEGSVACMKEENPVTITAETISLKSGETIFQAEANVPKTIHWYSDPEGFGNFYETLPSGRFSEEPKNPLTTRSSTVMYEGEDKIKGYLKSFGYTQFVEGTLLDACKFNLSLPTCEDGEVSTCRNLTYEISSHIKNRSVGNEEKIGGTPLPTTDIYIIKPSVTYLPEKTDATVNYRTLPLYGVFAEKTKITLPTMPQVPLEIPEPVENWSSNKINIPVSQEVYFYPMQTLEPGTYIDVISISATGYNPNIEPNCIKHLSLISPEKEACQSIQLNATPSWSPIPSTTPPSTKLHITGDFGDYEGKFEFEVSSTDSIGHLSESISANESKPKIIEVTKAKAISGIHMFGPTLETNWNIRVRASEEDTTACQAGLEYIPPPPPEVSCEKLEIITPSSPWSPNTTKTEENFEVKITGTPTDHVWTTVWSVPVNPSNTASFENQTTTTNKNVLKNLHEGVTAFVKVQGTPAGVCEASISPTYEAPKCEKLEIIKPSSPWYLDPDEDEEDFEIRITGTPANHVWSTDWTLTKNPKGTASFTHSTTTSLKNTLKNPYEGITTKIKVRGTPDSICEAYISPEVSEKINPSIKKWVRKTEMTDKPGASEFNKDWDDLINISAKGTDGTNTNYLPSDSKFVTYKVEFKTGEGKGLLSTLIQETSFGKNGALKGSKGGKLTFQNLHIEVSFKNSSAKKYLYKNADDEEDDDDLLEICEYKSNGDLKNTKVCVTDTDTDADDYNDIAEAFKDGTEGLVFNNLEKVNKITIFYELKNETILDQAKCATLNAQTDGCGEEFPNEVEFEAYDENDLEGKDVGSGDDDAKVIAICPFILTRAGGDVFFSSALTSGIDVAYCSEQKNIAGPIIRGIRQVVQEVPKTGSGTIKEKAYLTTPTHDICKYSNVEGATSAGGAYDNPLKNFSSTICEMQAEVAKEWQQEYIVKQINKNLTALSRWNEQSGSTTVRITAPDKTTNIYSYNNKDVTIEDLTVGIGDDSASQTYIIRNGTLKITGDIKYSPTSTMTQILNPRKVPSAAFIVIDGNIEIDPEVKVLDGTFIAIDTDGKNNDGKVNSLGNRISYNPLTINGILIGNVENLFSQRRYSGSVSIDQGSVTIKFSQNFLFNPPAGLSQLLDLTQLKKAF